MKAKVIKWFKAIPIPIWYLTIALFMITNYTANRTNMIEQDAWVNVIETGVTLNFVLFSLVFVKISNTLVKKTGIDPNSVKGFLLWTVIWTTCIALLVTGLHITGSFPLKFV